MKTKDLYFYLTAICAVLILAIGAFVFFSMDLPEYKYVIKSGGVDFVSNEAPPAQILDGIRLSDTIVVTPEFAQGGDNANSYMTASLTTFLVVLSAKGKKPIILARVVDSNGALVGCNSNFGDLKRNENVGLDECRKMFSDESAARIIIPLPSNKVGGPRVLLQKNSATVVARDFEGLGGVSFALAKALYPDAGDIINNVNVALGGVK